MPHQAHGIRWSVLTDYLKYQKPDLWAPIPLPADIVFAFKANQGKDIEHFAESFARNVDAHTVTERKKYPERYETPIADEVVVDDATAKRIHHTVYRWRKETSLRCCSSVEPTSGLCTHSDKHQGNCLCPLPTGERRTCAFLRPYVDAECYGLYSANAGSYRNVELVKTLLVYGEIEPLLRVCTHPSVDLAARKTMSRCMCDGKPSLGWDMVYKTALDAYLALNIIHCFLALWDPSMGCKRQDSFLSSQDAHIEDEYRNTGTYQRMVHLCTTEMDSPVPYYPHQQFFGIAGNDSTSDFLVDTERAMKWPSLMKLLYPEKWQRKRTSIDMTKFQYGQVPFDLLLNANKPVPHLVSSGEITQSLKILSSLGLPPELSLDIMDLAGYKSAGRRLPIAHDPFHPENKDELDKYLIYCWLTLVRCNMFAQALGIGINWKAEVIHSLRRVVGCPPGKMLFQEGRLPFWYFQRYYGRNSNRDEPCQIMFRDKHGQTERIYVINQYAEH